ncbi:hypothetical protein GCM10010971_14330 [Silvimonas amylolytica]|uniref:Uncharacterized protein n=1 Tax=Silvimonas amylolytica TaxID=449663 RepID=A0ABQ2PK54_9NEIS|nr:hypothetical protein GCM10010971_14330 [Silvimonas amylolytica]
MKHWYVVVWLHKGWSTEMENIMPGDQRDRRRNLRTALILAAVALVFFVGIMARHWLFGS